MVSWGEWETTPPPPQQRRRFSCHSFLNHLSVNTSLEAVACLDFPFVCIGGCVVFFFGNDLRWTVFFLFFSFIRMSLDQRLCPGVEGKKCGAFMSPLFRDLHPTCARCRGHKCSSDVTCGICIDWSVTQWEAFLKKCSYSVRRKSRPSSSSLPSASVRIPPIASASLEAGRRSPFLQPSSRPEGSGVAGASLGQGGVLTSSIVSCLGCGQRGSSCCTSIYSR